MMGPPIMVSRWAAGRAKVSNILWHYFFNNPSLTLILPRLFDDIPARVMAKFRADCWLCHCDMATEIPWSRRPVVGVGCWLGHSR